MYTVYQSVFRIPLPTSLTLGHLPPGGRFVGRGNKPPTVNSQLLSIIHYKKGEVCGAS